jgi:hypothetical protein
VLKKIVRGAAVAGLLSASIVTGLAGTAQAATPAQTHSAAPAAAPAAAKPTTVGSNWRHRCYSLPYRYRGTCDTYGYQFPFDDPFWSGGGDFWDGFGSSSWCARPYGYGGYDGGGYGRYHRWHHRRWNY